jgi:hypothetical protein
VHDEAGEHLGTDLVQLEVEAGDDAEIAAAAADRPEELGIFSCTRPPAATVWGDDVDADKAVDGEPVLRDSQP